MNLFVTGATGFVGSNFLKQAHALGHRIKALRRRGSHTRIPLDFEVDWVEAELDEDLSNHFSEIDCVVHLASHTPNPPYDTLEKCLYWNVLASAKLLQTAAHAGVRKFVATGTYFEYGSAGDLHERIPPSCELRPTLSYPISKAAASVALLGSARELNLELQVLRLFQVYGEGEAEKRFWPSLRKAALAGEDFPMSAGTQIRDFINVSDVAKNICETLKFSEVKPGRPHIRNIGTGKGQSLLTFAQSWWEVWKAKGRLIPGALPSRPGERPKLVANIEDIHVA
ncbi:MAG: NAD(P)-dependent oxidoreductase [Proteobacteria bacterium]|nr:NAD(P)-dependent oxidoreductase [Pseudomonadota bacterium]